MENKSLTHWGIKGMKWGIRRFQNRDGSLTPAGRKRYNDDAPEETVEEKRARLLKSTNADELYKNRSLLTTAEINERMQRIDTEARLGALAAKSKKTGKDYVNKALDVGKTLHDIYDFTQKPMMKALSKKLFGEKDKPKKISDLENALENLNKLSDDEVAALSKRANNVSAIKRALNNNLNNMNVNAELAGQIDDLIRRLEELENK